MSRRGKSTLSVQLFPFLAVLVCVMGSLIFLLLVTTKRMRAVAVERALATSRMEPNDPPLLPEFVDEPPPSPPQRLPDLAATAVPQPTSGPTTEELLAEWQQRVSQLQREQAQRAAAVERQERLAGAAVKRVEQLREELAALEARLGTLTGQLSAARMNSPSHDADRIRLEQQILRLRQRLKQEELQRRENEGKFSITAFDGKSATSRRPILIECTATGFRFLPEDVTLAPNDLEGFTERVNPLLAGSMALVQYWQQWNDRAPTETESHDPYVLLIVRPSGTLAYYIAMKLLSVMKQPFGYELVAEDLELALPAVDHGAQSACRSAIEHLLRQRADVIHAVGQGRRSGPGGNSDGPATGQPASPTPRLSRSFAMDDLEPNGSSVGSRSWERPERFRGKEHRPGRLADEPGDTESPSTSAPRVTAVPDEQEPSAGAGEGDGHAPERPYPNFGPAPKKSTGGREIPYEQLHRRRWGQSEPGATIGVERDVTVRLDAERMVVGDQFVLAIPAGSARNQIMDSLLLALDRHANSWGKPRREFYWTLRLKFVISPGGNQHYERIAPLVVRSGLINEVEHSLEAITLPKSGDAP